MTDDETDDQLRARLRASLPSSRTPSPDQVACAFALVLARYGCPCWVVVGAGSDHGELVVDIVSWSGWQPSSALLYAAREALVEFMPVWLLLTVTLNPKRDPRGVAADAPGGAGVGAPGGPAVIAGATAPAGAYRRLRR